MLCETCGGFGYLPNRTLHSLGETSGGYGYLHGITSYPLCESCGGMGCITRSTDRMMTKLGKMRLSKAIQSELCDYTNLSKNLSENVGKRLRFVA